MPLRFTACAVVLTILAASASAQINLNSYPSPVSSDAYGSALSAIDDLDGDGIRDVIVGAPGDSSFGFSSGRVDVISSATGALLLTIAGSSIDDRFGHAVASPGDVDGDGIADLAVTAAGAPLGSEAGQLSVFSGANGALLWMVQGAAGAGLGRAVAAVDDVDGDGVQDLAVSAPQEWTTTNYFGTVRVFSGASGSLIHTIAAQDDHSPFGASLAGLSDLDGDGTSEYVIGSPFGPSPVIVVDGATGTAQRVITEPLNAAQFGGRVASAKDLDQDGIDDILVGAPAASHVRPFGGAIFAYSGFDGTLIFRADGNTNGGLLGWSVADAGDVDGDGYNEIAAGAPGGYLYWLPNVRGRVSFYDNTGMPIAAIWGAPDGATGTTIAAIGDLGDDGFADIAIGEPGQLVSQGHLLIGAVRAIHPYGPEVNTETLSWDPGAAIPVAGTVDISSAFNAPTVMLLSGIAAGTSSMPNSIGSATLLPDPMPLLIDMSVGSSTMMAFSLIGGNASLPANLSNPGFRGVTFFLQGFTVDLAGGGEIILRGTRGLEFRL